MIQPHKTLAEIKDSLAKAKGHESFNHMVDNGFGVGLNEILDLCDEAAELYASQSVKKDEESIVKRIHDLYHELPECGLKNHLEEWFSLPGQSKKDEVSSDVEQAARDWFEKSGKNIYTDYNTMPAFIAGYKHCQSTQQPATINFFSYGEIKDLAYLFHNFTDEGEANNAEQDFIRAANLVQSKLKDRVNCVDPVELDFANWCRIHDKKHPNEVWTIHQLHTKYLTSKNKTDEYKP